MVDSTNLLAVGNNNNMPGHYLASEAHPNCVPRVVAIRNPLY
jgi:hypothetical protein